MEALFASGRIVDLILALVLVEVAVLLVLLRRRSSSFRLGLLANVAAGASLLVALRLALAGAWWGWIGASLACALVAHLADLTGRLKT